MNVAGFAVMMVGGAGWAFDVSGGEELRGRLRERRRTRGGGWGGGKDGKDGDGGRETEELEEWVAGMLGRKEIRERGSEKAGKVEGEGYKGVERRRQETR